MKKIIWLIASCLVVFALVLASCGTAEEEAPSGEEEEATEGPTPIFNEPAQPFTIGETAQSSRTKVTILEVSITDSYEYDDPVSKGKATKEASPGTSFVLVTLEIKNVGTLRRGEGKARTRIIMPDNTLFLSKPYLGANAMRNFVYLAAGETMQGTVVFEVPKEAADFKVRYGMVQYPDVADLADEKWAEWQIE